MKVLIVEDEKAMSNLIAIKFKVEGFEVEEADTLAKARQLLTTNGNGPFAGMLTDYLLPDGNSIEFIEWLKTDPRLKNLPILIMTNYIEDINLEKTKSLGVSEVLIKYQVVPAQMVDKMKQLIMGVSRSPGS